MWTGGELSNGMWSGLAASSRGCMGKRRTGFSLGLQSIGKALLPICKDSKTQLGLAKSGQENSHRFFFFER